MVIHHQIHQFKSKTTLIALITVAYISMISIVCNTYADTTVTSDVSVTVSSSCTFTAGGGTYSESVVGGNTATITANPITTNCNDPSGYAIYAIGYSGDSYSATTHTDMISSLGSSYNIKTDGTGTYGSSWKMKLTNPSNATISGSFGSSYQNIPSTFTQVATYANNTTSGSITPSYQVAVSSSQPAGTYTGKVKYVLVHPNTTVAGTYNIAYNANGGSGTMSSSTGLYNFEEQTLPTSTFTAPTGYAFAGWCTTNTSQYSCTDGVLYQSGDGVTSLGTAGSTVTLYAIWNELCAGYTTMQGLDSSSIATLLPTTGSTATVCDTRDEEKYTIAKLADGKYWMTTNLNLAGGTTLNASDSNVPSDNYYTLPASTTISSGTSVPSDQFSSDTTAYVFNTGNNTTTCNSSTPCNSYYSWLAATAGGKNSSGSSVTTNGYNAAYSICPKGWRLPTSTTSNASAQSNNNWKTGDWYALATAYGANLESDYYQNAATFYNNAGPGTTPNFLLAGYYYDGSFSDGGSNGYYWSSTARSSTDAYLLYFYSGLVNSAGYNNRRLGRSVRCVFGE